MLTNKIAPTRGIHQAIVPLSNLNRFLAAIVGGYLFAYGFTALATLTGFGAGLPFSEAQALAWMAGALVYLGAMLWGFVPRSTTRAWLVLAGGGAAMGTVAYAASRWAI